MPNNQHSYKETFERLYTIAEGQGGYFTPKQAAAAGFSRKNHSYHVQMGNWIRERRGISHPTACCMEGALRGIGRRVRTIR